MVVRDLRRGEGDVGILKEGPPELIPLSLTLGGGDKNYKYYTHLGWAALR